MQIARDGVADHKKQNVDGREEGEHEQQVLLHIHLAPLAPSLVLGIDKVLKPGQISRRNFRREEQPHSRHLNPGFARRMKIGNAFPLIVSHGRHLEGRDKIIQKI